MYKVYKTQTRATKLIQVYKKSTKHHPSIQSLQKSVQIFAQVYKVVYTFYTLSIQNVET